MCFTLKACLLALPWIALREEVSQVLWQSLATCGSRRRKSGGVNHGDNQLESRGDHFYGDGDFAKRLRLSLTRGDYLSRPDFCVRHERALLSVTETERQLKRIWKENHFEKEWGGHYGEQSPWSGSSPLNDLPLRKEFPFGIGAPPLLGGVTGLRDGRGDVIADL
ncbi:hypothetical protein CDAR_52991 [Caerostris darwini]|uniref:Uncharacterized protein n=1 Tax=Caerostris darwini TaxID=1538125 RepID=A0AAV4QU58_9ARAC|nr:hypothetical protein CDAR_52991 [Caerostris darwini]